jgi:hypothetical protein
MVSTTSKQEGVSMKVIDIDLGQEDVELHCPKCGEFILPVPHAGVCDHVLFLHTSMHGPLPDVNGLGDKFETLLTNDEVEGFADGDVSVALDNMHLPETAFVIAVTTSGMSCGPCSNTDHVCINME